MQSGRDQRGWWYVYIACTSVKDLRSVRLTAVSLLLMVAGGTDLAFQHDHVHGQQLIGYALQYFVF